MFKLVKINKNNKDDQKILYELLAKKKFNISHNNLPNIREHCNFVLNNPYRVWFFLKNSIKVVGSVYLTKDNIIGLNIPNAETNDYVQCISLVTKKLKPLEPIKSVRSKFFSVNVNPKNIKLIRALNLLKMEHVENTYILREK